MAGYLGAYLGAAGGAVTNVIIVVAGATPTTEPVPSPYTPSSPAYYDHVQVAINRLCEYAKAKSS
jgi:hypothetical protein